MSLTREQQTVIDTVSQEGPQLVKVKAVAGSGKTYTLVEMIKALNPKSGRYLAYNKAIATEAAEKFAGTNIECSTIHSMAYRAVVNQYGLKVGFFNIRDVQGDGFTYANKKAIHGALENFFLSKYLDPDEFLDSVESKVSDKARAAFMDNLDAMANGTVQCSHSFYLKYFHILLANGTISMPEVDMLLVDEAGDITELTLEIFKLLKAEKKIAVGDPMQNIYSFNNTINAFEVLEGGTDLGLTTSFRMADNLATGIEYFVRSHLDEDFVFKGREYPADEPIVTKAYIARNNAGLLAEMFRLMDAGRPFHITRPIATILEVPLMLANLGNGQKITEYRFKDVEKLRSYWEKSPAAQKFGSVQKYVMHKFSEDAEMKQAYKVVMTHGPMDLNHLAKYAKSCAAEKCSLTLTTAHSSKGLEFSAVEIAPDFNDTVEKAIRELDKFKKKQERYGLSNVDVVKQKQYEEELRLYYVGTTRAMVELTNAKFIGL